MTRTYSFAHFEQPYTTDACSLAHVAQPYVTEAYSFAHFAQPYTTDAYSFAHVAQTCDTDTKEDHTVLFRKEEMEAEEYITKHCFPFLKELKIPFLLEIARTNPDVVTVGSMIARRADTLGASAIVMARHNRILLKEFFVGSVTKACMHHAKVPLYIVNLD
eukprot:gene21502-28483_t